MRDKPAHILGPREHYAADYALVMQQESQEGYKKRKTTTLQVRRVRRDYGEEVQIEIGIETHHETRTSSAHDSFILTPDLAVSLATELLTVREKDQPNKPAPQITAPAEPAPVAASAPAPVQFAAALRLLASIRAHDDALDKAERVPTTDDYNEILTSALQALAHLRLSRAGIEAAMAAVDIRR